MPCEVAPCSFSIRPACAAVSVLRVLRPLLINSTQEVLELRRLLRSQDLPDFNASIMPRLVQLRNFPLLDGLITRLPLGQDFIHEFLLVGRQRKLAGQAFHSMRMPLLVRHRDGRCSDGPLYNGVGPDPAQRRAQNEDGNHQKRCPPATALSGHRPLSAKLTNTSSSSGVWGPVSVNRSVTDSCACGAGLRCGFIS